MVELEIHPVLQARMATLGITPKIILNRLLAGAARKYEENMHKEGELLEYPDLISTKVVEEEE